MSGTTQRSPALAYSPRAEVKDRPGNAPQACAPVGEVAGDSELTQPLSLRTNVSWVFVGNVVYAVSRWAMVVALANLGSTEVVGLVVLAFALGAPLYSLSNLGLRGALVTDVKRQYGFQDYLSLRLITSVLALLVVAGMVWSMGYNADLVLLTIIAGLGKLFESVSDIFHGLLQRQERMDRIAMALVMREPAAVFSLAVGLYVTGDVVWSMVGFPVAMAATLFLYDIPNAALMLRASGSGRASGRTTEQPDRLAPRWHVRTMLGLLWLCVPLGVIMSMITLAVNIPRYAVEYYLGETALGVFASITYIFTAPGTLITAIGQSASPRLAKHYAAGDVAAYCGLLGKLLAVVAAVGFGMVVVMAAAGRPILRWLYGAEFVDFAPLAVHLMLASALTNLCGPLGRAVDSARQFWTHMFIRTAGILVLLGLLPSLVQARGLEGASTAILVSAGVSIVLYSAAISFALARLRRPAGITVGHLTLRAGMDER